MSGRAPVGFVPKDGPGRGLTLGVFLICTLTALTIAYFGWEDLSILRDSVERGLVRVEFGRASLAVPGLLLGLLGLSVMTAWYFLTGAVGPRLRLVGNALLVAAVVLGLAGFFIGGGRVDAWLGQRGYAECPKQGPTRLFLNESTWALHETFCVRRAEFEGLTVEDMRRDIDSNQRLEPQEVK